MNERRVANDFKVVYEAIVFEKVLTLIYDASNIKDYNTLLFVNAGFPQNFQKVKEWTNL